MNMKKLLFIGLTLALVSLGGLSFDSDDKHFEMSKQLTIFSMICCLNAAWLYGMRR